MNTLEAALSAMKTGFDAEANRDTEKLKIVWNYQNKTISVFIKYADSPEAYSPGPVPLKDDPESLQFGKMLLGSLKEKLVNCKEVVYMLIIFDLVKNEIEKSEVYYLDHSNIKQTFKDGK